VWCGFSWKKPPVKMFCANNVKKRTIHVAAAISFVTALAIFLLALAVQSDPSELEFFVGWNLFLALLSPMVFVVLRRWSVTWSVTPSLFLSVSSLVFILVNLLFLAFPHWRYPPQWNGGPCVLNPDNSTCLMQASLSPVLAACHVQRGILMSSETGFLLPFSNADLMVDVPLQVIPLLLDQCSFYCGTARFFSKVDCGVLNLSLHDTQTHPNQYFNYMMVFLPSFALMLLFYFVVAWRRRWSPRDYSPGVADGEDHEETIMLH
jgi:hypothetical protein